MAETPDVPADPSPAPETVEPQAAPVAAPVSAEVPVLPDDRPERNVLGEMRRREAELRREMQAGFESLRSLVAQQSKPSPPVAEVGAEYSDEQLASLATSGNQQALTILMERIATKKSRAEAQMTQRDMQVQQGMQALMARYPFLSDSSHPATQAVYQARSLLMGNGHPAGLQTDLQAVTNAIVAAPQLFVTSAAPVSPDGFRRSGVQAQNAVDGSSPRRNAPAAPAKPVLSAETQALAQRMNVKDPTGARKRHEERLQKGQSQMGLGASSFVRESS